MMCSIRNSVWKQHTSNSDTIWSSNWKLSSCFLFQIAWEEREDYEQTIDHIAEM